jgi:salicylate hydroxylase
MRVGVIGGGIGGLCTAVALAKFGFDVHVFEQARELREVGAGVGVGPNAVSGADGLQSIFTGPGVSVT